MNQYTNNYLIRLTTTNVLFILSLSHDSHSRCGGWEWKYSWLSPRDHGCTWNASPHASFYCCSIYCSILPLHAETLLERFYSWWWPVRTSGSATATIAVWKRCRRSEGVSAMDPPARPAVPSPRIHRQGLLMLQLPPENVIKGMCVPPVN